MKRDIKKLFKDEFRRETKSFTLHSWSTEELDKLRDIRNHRIIKDKFGYYIWECNLSNKWERRSVVDYETSKKPYSELYFWLSIWNKEYTKRIEHAERKRLRDETARYEEAIRIINSEGIKRAEKVRLIYDLLSDITKKQVAELTGMSYIQVKRILS
jgi:GMP synthase PP-ATPase subunit